MGTTAVSDAAGSSHLEEGRSWMANFPKGAESLKEEEKQPARGNLGGRTGKGSGFMGAKSPLPTLSYVADCSNLESSLIRSFAPFIDVVQRMIPIFSDKDI